MITKEIIDAYREGKPIQFTTGDAVRVRNAIYILDSCDLTQFKGEAIEQWYPKEGEQVVCLDDINSKIRRYTVFIWTEDDQFTYELAPELFPNIAPYLGQSLEF